MAVWTEMPRLASLALAVIGLSAVARGRVFNKGALGHWWSAVAWSATVTIPASVLFTEARAFTLDIYQGVMAWMMGGSILLACDLRAKSCGDSAWKLLVAAWTLLGCLIWVSEGYLHNLPGHFFFGVFLSVGFVIACKLCFRMATWAIIASNTVMLLLVGLPLADLLMRPRYHFTTHPDANRKYYSYNIAKMDPATFDRWWDYYRDQYDLLAGKVYQHEAGDVVSYRFIPNSQSLFFESRVSINSNGFRGRARPGLLRITRIPVLRVVSAWLSTIGR